MLIEKLTKFLLEVKKCSRQNDLCIFVIPLNYLGVAIIIEFN